MCGKKSGLICVVFILYTLYSILLCMRLLGIDYGTRRVGIALTDEGGQMAFPHSVLERNKELVEKIKTISNNEHVREIIIGKSVDYKQKENPIMKEVYALKDKLEDTLGIPVYLEPEFLTTAEAKRLQGKHKKTHASAASLILQSYINKREIRES